jgi:apolipoprotein D and lipocalin family protein
MGEIPEGLTPVENFDLQRYLGTWYEMARLDHSFERGLSRVTAEYALNEDGTVSVLNRGWDAEAGRWKEARGTAECSGDPGTGSLKVTFFWPFSGDYHIIDLDREGYRWALVTGSSREYLWILSREPRLDPAVKAQLVAKAKEAGFDTETLVWVEQS